jgi:virulence factor Mce-like protein
VTRRSRGSIASSPVLIGAVAVLVTVVAVFLAYNANNGLPFVPVYRLDAEVPNASGLIKGNDVRIGGARVGVVTAIRPLIRPDGSAGAVLRLHLDRSLVGLPRDSRIAVRPRSPLGLKYVEITAGHSRETFPDGSTMPLANARSTPVELDDLFGMFDAPTRAASQTNLLEFGDGLASRGSDLNRALHGLAPLVEHAEPALRSLNAPATHFDRLFPALEQAAREVAPVADQQADLFSGLDRTFTAWSSVGPQLQESISGGPRALDVATTELPAQAGFVRDSEELFRRLRPGFSHLAAAAPALASAFGAGAPALRRSPSLNARLVQTLQALERFAADQRVAAGLARLRTTADLLAPTIAFATPAQTTCNYLALFFHNLGSALSESDVVGSFLRFGITALPQGANSEAGPSSAPSNVADGAFGPADRLPIDDFLQSNPYPNTAAPGQVHECEAGNERYTKGRAVIGNEPGNQGVFSEKTTRSLR